MADVVYWVQDLLFTSKIRETAKQIGLSAEAARDPEALRDGARAARAVIVDLRLPRALEALELFSPDAEARQALSIGFIDHEPVRRMELARSKGCGKVLANGKFSSDLAALLAGSSRAAAALSHERDRPPG